MSQSLPPPPPLPSPPPPSLSSGCPAEALDVLASAVQAMAAVDPTRARVGDLGRHLVRLQELADCLHGTASRWTAAFSEAGGPELDGSATLAGWFRQHLRLTPADARRRSRAGYALAQLPATRAALESGLVGSAHVDVIAAGVHRLGPDVVAGFERVLLDVAEACDADDVRTVLKKVEETLDPDAAERAYVRALERRDVTVAKAGDGYALAGFLDPTTGSMLQQLLYSAAKPDGKHDDRPAGHRRVDALQEVCRAWLDHGLPTDRGFRPHLLVTVTADRLDAVVSTQPGHAVDTTACPDAADPAVLAGFGEITDALLAQLACDCAATPVLVDGLGPHPGALDVGRTRRLATGRQRAAVSVQQGGSCYNPGCDRTRLEIHHMTPWKLGGPTDLANLRGYCTRCHHLIHQGHLVTTPDGQGGWRHTTRTGRQLDDRRRHSRHSTARFTRALLAGGLQHANEQLHRRRRGLPGQPGVAPTIRPSAPLRT